LAFTNKAKDVYIKGTDRDYGDAGVVVAIAVGEATTWTGSVTGGVSAEAGIIFAKASTSFSVTISASHSTTVTKSGSWTVPESARKGGYLEAGASGISFDYKKTYWVSPCKKKTVSGSAKGLIPTSSVWFSTHVL
jgi:hypothetical protein